MSEKETPAPEQQAPEYQRVYDAMPDDVQERMVGAAYDEAHRVRDMAEDLYRESELAKAREAIERAGKHGAAVSEHEARAAERKALDNMAENPPKNFIQAAEAELRRAERVSESVDASTEDESEARQVALRMHADQWARFLDTHDGSKVAKDRGEQAVRNAKEFEQAVEASPFSADFKRELRADEFDLVEGWAMRKSGRVDAEALEAARRKLVEMVRADGIKPEPAPVPLEILNYGVSRAKRWGKALFGSRKRMLATVVVGLGATTLAPVAATVGFAAGVAASLEVGRAAFFGGTRALERGGERLTRKSRERNIRGDRPIGGDTMYDLGRDAVSGGTGALERTRERLARVARERKLGGKR